MKAVGESREMHLFMEQINNLRKAFAESFLGTEATNSLEALDIHRISALAFEEYGKLAQNFLNPCLGDAAS